MTNAPTPVIEEGPYTCCRCTASTWNDDDWCDACVAEAQKESAPAPAGMAAEPYRLVVGDWKEDPRTIHGPDGYLVGGLEPDDARRLCAELNRRAAQPSAGAEPVGHFQFNDGWNAWEQVVEDEAGKEGVVALYTHPAPVLTAVDVDALAQEIRRVDGSNSLGAGALAEALWPFVTATPVQPDSGGVVEVLRSEVNGLRTPAHIELSRIFTEARGGVKTTERDQELATIAINALAALAPVAAEGGEKLSAGEHWWNPDNNEEGFNNWPDAFEDATFMGWDHQPIRLQRAKKLPDVWAVRFDLDTDGDGEADDWEARLFATEDEAKTYMAAALRTEPTGGGEG